MNITDLKVENTNFNIVNEKFVISESIHQIKFDIGLSWDAPNSAIWLDETKDRFVFGIEPLDFHWEHLYDFGKEIIYPNGHPMNYRYIQLKTNSVNLNNNIISDISGRFCGLKCAIDDVSGIVKRKFYELSHRKGLHGGSSLLEPSKNHPTYVKYNEDLSDIIDVNVISLSSIMDYIDWNRFEYIEQVKTDCEGYDYFVVKSIGKYLDRIVFITSEASNPKQWINAPNQDDFIKFMTDNNFSVINFNGGNVNFVNNKLRKHIGINNLNNKTLGL